MKLILSSIEKIKAIFLVPFILNLEVIKVGRKAEKSFKNPYLDKNACRTHIESEVFVVEPI